MPTVFSLKEGDFFISNAIKKTQKKNWQKFCCEAGNCCITILTFFEIN